MEIQGFVKILTGHPVFREFDPQTLAVLAGCARNECFKVGDTIFGEGDPADKVFILRHGDVAIEISSAERAPIIVETLHAGDLLGWSWMVPPYRHMSDARALSQVRAVSLDANCLRGKCDENPVVGYNMFQHWLPFMAKRMASLRMQLLDLYGTRKG